MFQEERQNVYDAIHDAVKAHLFGADCYAYGLLSTGWVDVVIEADMKVFDYMAMVPIVEGAGGMITDWKGNALKWDGVRNHAESNWATEILAVGDRNLHSKMVRLIQSATKEQL